MSLLLKDIPKDDGGGLRGHSQAELLCAIENLWIIAAGLTHAGKIALYIGHEYGDANAAESLRHCLQCYRFSCSGRARNEAVAIAHLGYEF